MTSPGFRRAVILALLALFMIPIVVLGVSPADGIHGLAGPFKGVGGVTVPTGGL